jgi:hypothetical protein
MSVSVTLDEPLVRWALSLKGVTPEQAILDVLREHAAVSVPPVEQALALFKQSLLKFPAGVEFEVPQVIGSATWNTYERATRLTLGKRIRKEAEALGIEFMHKTTANHAVYQRKLDGASGSKA